MTKDEYERLLKSDYWKGYSYSLIKERNFTCEDCGRRFYGERNKLQVHHLVYRDVNPWSYSPDEVVVLCEDCHKKRHGIATKKEAHPSFTQSPFGDDVDNPFTIDGEVECPFNDPSPFGDGVDNPFTIDDGVESLFSSQNDDLQNSDNHNSYDIEPEQKRGSTFRYIIYGLLLFLFIMIGRDVFFKQKSITSDRPSYENKELPIEDNHEVISVQSEEVPLEVNSPSKTKRENKPASNNASEISVPADEMSAEVEPTVTTNPTRTEPALIDSNDDAVQETPQKELSTLEILERRNHEDVVRRAKRAGVSTEGTTIEILERINHADVVKRAQRAGVSTEGSTIDILERINHADVVKRAQRAGVSTEGSTIDILERINHADVVKRAQRLGVSTEGSTIEILERINRKEMEKYNY